MADPTPFLSTVTGSSAAMVAIIGGLLVARFVTLDSEQEGAQHTLDDAEARLSKARERAMGSAGKLHGWLIDDFFEYQVFKAIGAGTHDPAELRKIGGWTELTDAELTEAIGLFSKEFTRARETIAKLDLTKVLDSGREWEGFRDATPELAGLDWDKIWEICFDEATAPPPKRSSSFAPFPDYSAMIPALAVRPDPAFQVLRLQRRDTLKGNLSRDRQQVEDLEGEVFRLRQKRDAIVRPKGLIPGLVVLGIFTASGVVYPIWLMHDAPSALTHSMGMRVFWLFFGSLILLLGYMGGLALRLSIASRRHLKR